MTDDDLEILDEFRTESLEHFEQVEPLLLEIEDASGSRRTEVVNAIFRAVHSVKGAAGFFELTPIQELAHASESLLMKVRDGELEYRSEMTDVLLTALDQLRVMVESMPDVGNYQVEDHVQRLLALSEGVAPEPNDTSQPDSDALDPDASPSHGIPEATALALVSQVDPARLEATRQNGRRLFVFNRNDLQSSDRVEDGERSTQDLLAVGETLHTKTEDDAHWVVFETVLEKHLLSDELGLASDALIEVPIPPAPTPNEDAREASTEAGYGKAAPSENRTESNETVRVSVRLLDKLMNLAGELVLARNQLVSQVRDVEDNNLRAVLQNVDLVTSELQAGIMDTRMQPVGSVFKRFNRVVRDLSRSLNKKARLELEGSDVELDRSIIEMLSDPLTHLVRNAIDHGLELPEERTESGKDEMGCIQLRAYHENGLVNIEVNDDGAGIDPDKMRRSAVEKGLLSETAASRTSDGDALKMIFAAGFSTASEVTDVSGRGVGMDVVRANIHKLGGTVDIDSTRGAGSQLRIRLPLTLAILPSLIVAVGDERFAVPQVNVTEVVRIHPDERDQLVESVRGAEMLRHREGLLPLVWLSEVLDIPGVRSGWDEMKEENPATTAATAIDDDGSVVVLILRADEHQYGLIIDRIYDTEEIVVKPLSELLKECRAFAGATIMGDGQVAMILDVGRIAIRADLRFDDDATSTLAAREDALDASDARKVLLFSSSPTDQFALDLDRIVRLERIQIEEIERVGNQSFMKYGGSGWPLLSLDERLPVQAFEPKHEEVLVIIPRVDNCKMGILVREVIDTVSVDAKLDRDPTDPAGCAGRAVIEGKLTMFLDPLALLESPNLEGAS